MDADSTNAIQNCIHRNVVLWKQSSEYRDFRSGIFVLNIWTYDKIYTLPSLEIVIGTQNDFSDGSQYYTSKTWIDCFSQALMLIPFFHICTIHNPLSLQIHSHENVRFAESL